MEKHEHHRLFLAVLTNSTDAVRYQCTLSLETVYDVTIVRSQWTTRSEFRGE
jgi:hypothetical protein